MLLVLGIIVSVIGVLLALLSAHYPYRFVSMERWCGGLFIIGIVVIVIHFPIP